MSNYYLSHSAAELDEAVEKVLTGYKDVSSVTATGNDVVIGKTIVDSSGNVINGSLNTDQFYSEGYTAGVIDGNITGYQQGLQDATPTLQSKEVIPSLVEQTITADTGFDGLLSVFVQAVPKSILDAEYQKGFDEAFELYKPYQRELAYIESTGTQYIDTGFKPNQDTRVVCKALITIDGTSKLLFGGRKSTAVDGFAFGASNTDAFMTLFGKHRIYFSDEYNSDDFIVIDKNRNTATITLLDGTTTTITHNEYTFTSPVNMILFGVNTNGTLALSPSKICYMQIYDNDVLVRDYIPVLDVDDVPCLYDKVTHKFYYNVGTGNFNYPVDLPEGYTQLSYIKASGTQYIRTGFAINGANINKYKIVADMSIDGTSGWRVSGSGDTNPIFHVGVSNQNVFSYGNGTTDIHTTITADNKRHLWILDCANKTFIVDRLVNLSGISIGTSTASRNFAIGGYANSDTNAVCHAETIYGYMFYENDFLVGHYVPCKNASGTVGLYDLVNKKFYTNAGSGTFTYA